MRFGVCADIGAAVELAACGYHYIELSAAGDLVPDAAESEWLPKRRAIDAMPLRPETFNSFVRTLRIVGPEAEPHSLRSYVGTAMRRASEVGGKIIVFGSSGARNLPDGYPPDLAEAQIIEFLNWCADASAASGVTIAIEPLNRGESNCINTVAEGAALARKIGRPGVLNLADTYHMELEHEPLSAILESADVLAHVHTSDTGRLAPGAGSCDYAALFGTLKQAKYDERISIECSWQGRLPQLAGPALHCLTAAMASVGQ